MPYPDQISDSMMAEIRRRLAEAENIRVIPGVGEVITPRFSLSSSSSAFANQRLILTGFTAARTEFISQIRTWSGGTAAGATPTLVRLGVYARGADLNYTLVASIANDTSLYATTNTTYTKSFTTPFLKTAGTYYLVGALVVSGAAFPSLLTMGTNGTTTIATDLLLLAPPIIGSIAAQADLPNTFAESAVTSTSTGGGFQALLMV